MLKGHVFSRQLFGNPIFALFINTFLGGGNGVSKDYGNNMQISYSGSNITIQNGAVCIQGRFLEEDTSTTINVGTDVAFCKLVLEIDLDQENTNEQFNQGSYKILKGAADYPSLIQENIVRDNSGKYQFELARFKTGISGITDFEDRRKYLDFNSIYEDIRKHIQEIDDGSAFQTKNNYATITGILSEAANNYEATATLPEGFTTENTVIVSVMLNNPANNEWSTGTIFSSASYISGGAPISVRLKDNSLLVRMRNINFAENGAEQTAYVGKGAAFNYKVVLMKLPELIEGTDYILGDVNGDRQINQDDIDIIRNYIDGKIAFTDKQQKAADVNRDGVVDTGDTFRIQQYINGVIDHF